VVHEEGEGTQTWPDGLPGHAEAKENVSDYAFSGSLIQFTF